MKKIAIIGGGAAGLAAAISAAQSLCAQSKPYQVVVYEAADRIGKSILATGNGRCNFSNLGLEAQDYFNHDFVEKSFEVLPPSEVLAFFHNLGLMWYEEAQGRLYPLTNKASSVLDVLRFAAQDRGVEFRLRKNVCALTPLAEPQTSHSVLVTCEDTQSELFDAAIVACGGKISASILPPQYRFINTQPLLAPLKTNTDAIKGLNNIRVRCEIRGGEKVEYGEVLFREYGVSGIAVFNISRFVKTGETFLIDFLPTLSVEQVIKMLSVRYVEKKQRSAVDFCAGMFLPAVARAIMRMAGIAPNDPLAPQDITALAGAVKLFPLQNKGIESSRMAQVQRGGFALESFDPSTLQSRHDPGLFVVGESLDVDGPCGGFNLHWAWTSGILAGRAAAQVST